MAIPNRYFSSANNIENGSRSTDTHRDIKPITEKVRQVDAFGGFTAAAGHNFYTARAFPKKYWNNIAFVSEPTGHVLHQNNMVRKGTDFSDKESFNLMAGADEWFSPVFAEVGPDGAVWVADWYSYIIQHNPTPQGGSNGEGNAYETPLRDFTHGRIYRVSYNGAAPYQPIQLESTNVNGLLAALKSDNKFWRTHAQRMLVERGNKDIVPQLKEMVANAQLDEIGINATAIHALWALKGLGALDEQTLEVALTHPIPSVRKNAIQVMEHNESGVAAILKLDLLNDKDLLVVMNALLYFSKSPMNAAAEKAFFDRMNKSTEVEDRWMPDAFAVVLNANGGKLMKKHLTERIKSSVAQKTAVATMDHSKHQTGAAPAAKAAAKVTGLDLVISDIKIDPAAPAVRERIAVTVEVKNQGSVDLPAEMFVPLDVRFEGQGIKIDQVSRNYKEGIKAGETVSITKNINGPWVGNLSFGTDVVGEYNLVVNLDKANEIAEVNKNNNYLSKKVNFVRPPDMNAFALERAIRSYASVAPLDSLVAMMRNTIAMDPQAKASVIKAISEGWNYRNKQVKLNPADLAFLKSMNTNKSNERLNKLMEAWGVVAEKATADVKVIRIKTIREAMKYDLKEFTVKPGQSVEIIIENPDAMQHNMVITKPGSLEKVGRAGDAMMKDEKGAEKNYVPALAEVLYSTPLINPGQSYKLKFKAPVAVGNYPYVCTFPGHWTLMNGVMKVVK
jgi:azurin